METVVEQLNALKFLDENLTVLNNEIHDKIDVLLKFYLKMNGMCSITQLIIHLERTDTGSRIISEHACLQGEDLRKRRKKMQKQDDIAYVLVMRSEFLSSKNIFFKSHICNHQQIK